MICRTGGSARGWGKADAAGQGQVFLDPGVYAASLGSALQFDVQRASYTKPITLTQVIYRPGGGTTTRPLPSSLLDGF